jgi:hypothetical protein
MKMNMGVEVELHALLTSALERSEQSTAYSYSANFVADFKSLTMAARDSS